MVSAGGFPKYPIGFINIPCLYVVRHANAVANKADANIPVKDNIHLTIFQPNAELYIAQC